MTEPCFPQKFFFLIVIRLLGLLLNALMVGHHFTWENCLLHVVSESQYTEFVLSYKLVTVNTFFPFCLFAEHESHFVLDAFVPVVCIILDL